MEIKLKADQNLFPIHNQLMGLITPYSKVIEFGCGEGDLLFKISPKIKYGLGIDKSRKLIETAKQQITKRGNVSNIEFTCRALVTNFTHTETYDFSIASLFFHVIPIPDAVNLLKTLKAISNTILICGISRPKTFSQKIVLWLDQRFSAHYNDFKAYQTSGYMEGLLSEMKNCTIEAHKTSIPFIKIYKIT